MNPQTTARNKRDARASEDAVKAMLAFAIGKAKSLGHHPSEVAAAIFGRTAERQAQSLMFDALIYSFSINATATTKILEKLRQVNRSRAHDFKEMADIWRMIAREAREQEHECWEYAGDAA